MLGCQTESCRYIHKCNIGKQLTTIGFAVSNKTDELPKEMQELIKWISSSPDISTQILWDPFCATWKVDYLTKGSIKSNIMGIQLIARVDLYQQVKFRRIWLMNVCFSFMSWNKLNPVALLYKHNVSHIISANIYIQGILIPAPIILCWALGWRMLHLEGRCIRK